MTSLSPIVRPDVNCWRLDAAGRAAVIVDAAAYFAALRAVFLAARHEILLIGWDIDTRVSMLREDGTDAPTRLGRLLNHVAEKRPSLQIRILKWDWGVLFTLGRGSTPFTLLNWMSKPNLAFRLDHNHPPTAAHHQKIVVVDGVIAFCGGIDVTAYRWDTPAHADDEPGRVTPTLRRRYPPWHDTALAVDGPAAAALRDLAARRWSIATGETIEPCPPADPIWPEGIVAQFGDVSVAIARTAPAWKNQDEHREVERLWLDAIAAARRSVYIESQYFASFRIAAAIAARLREPDGPEFVVVNPKSADGWLEEEAMGTARAMVLRDLARTDRHGRFALYTPVTEGGADIYVHAKVMIVDDRLLRIGSANVNNRSMGFDTECDLAIDTAHAARPDEAAATIRSVRAGLIAEHLGRPVAEVAATVERSGSLVATVEALRGRGRSLVPFDPPPTNGLERELAEREWADPEHVAHAITDPRSWRRRFRGSRARRRLSAVAGAGTAK